MKKLALLPASALTLFLFAGAPALADVQCSGGDYVADAEVFPPAEMGDVVSAVQWAWDGNEDFVQVCDLLTDTTFFASWSLFSGEVDDVRPGICVSLLNAAGDEWVSCQAPEAVIAAFVAPNGTAEAILQFNDWIKLTQ